MTTYVRPVSIAFADVEAIASYVASNLESRREVIKEIGLLKLALEGFDAETSLYRLELDDSEFTRLSFLIGEDRLTRQGPPTLNSTLSFTYVHYSEQTKVGRLYSQVTNCFSRVSTWAYRSSNRSPLRMTLLVMLTGYGVASVALLASVIYRGQNWVPELTLMLAGGSVTFVHWSLARFQISSLIGQVLNVGGELALVCYVAFLISELLSVRI